MSHWNENTQLVRTVAIENQRHQPPAEAFEEPYRDGILLGKGRGTNSKQVVLRGRYGIIFFVRRRRSKEREGHASKAFGRYIQLAKDGDAVPIKQDTINTYTTTLNHIVYLGMGAFPG